jgi:hypothetical protein
MVAVALSLFFFCIFNVAIGLLHNVHAFIESADPEQEFQKTPDWINVTRVSVQECALSMIVLTSPEIIIRK